MIEMGLPMDKHHHEVAAAQHELGLTYGALVETADRMQIYKYVVHMVAHAYGKTATFMPKPIAKDNGSGMHTHMSIWKGGKPLFAGNGYAGLSETSLYFIGGVIKHARALNAFTNPTTNSYKRLVPGFEAPVLLAYSSRNRSASCRIPYGAGEKAKRVEFRFPDAMANPYLAYSAIMMAGLDEIQNRIHPGDPMDKISTTSRRRNWSISRRFAARFARRWSRFKTIARFSPGGTSSATTRSTVTSTSSGKKSCAGRPPQARSNSTCIIPVKFRVSCNFRDAGGGNPPTFPIPPSASPAPVKNAQFRN